MNENIFFVPDVMKHFNNWVLWVIEDKNGRKTKVPYSANYKGRASSTNKNTWCPFDKAMSVYKAHKDIYCGVGFVFSKDTGLIFIDIDHCFTDEHKLYKSKADIVHRFKNTFWEISQSGSGLHGFCFGDIPHAVKNSNSGIELYQEKRFVAFTGNALLNNQIVDYSEEITRLFNEYNTKKPKNTTPVQRNVCDTSEVDILKLAMKNKKNGLLFSELYKGDWDAYYKSQSEADQSFCNMLAFWCDCDKTKIDSIFKSSGLYREKWEREDYKNNTIEMAIESCSYTFTDYKREHSNEWNESQTQALRSWREKKRAENIRKLQNPQWIY